MAHNSISGRVAIASAACDVAGRPRPAGMEIPRARRAFLFACPDEQNGPFRADVLAARLSEASVPHAVDYDRTSETYGLRFVEVGSFLPQDIHPFATEPARAAWAAWKDQERRMAETVVEAAGAMARGEEVDFRVEGDVVEDMGLKRKSRNIGERD